MLADHAGSVGSDLRKGKADVLDAGHFLEEGVVAPRDLAAALDQVARDDGAGEGVPVAALPAVVPGGGAADDRRIRRAAGHDDVGTALEGVDDAEATEIGVGREVAARILDRVSGLEMAELAARDEVREAWHQIVAAHERDLRREAEARRDLVELAGAALGIETPGIRDDLDAPLEAGPHDLLELGHEGPRITPVRPLRPRSGEDQHRQLGEPVARQHVDRAALDHLAHAGRAVPEIARAVRDPDRLGHLRLLD